MNISERINGPPRSAPIRRTRWNWLAASAAVAFVFLVVAATALAYRSVVRTGYFVSDDHSILRAASVPDGWSLFVRDPWLLSGVRHPEFWRPVGTLAWRLNYLLTGPSPQDFYLANLGLHLVNAALVAVLIWRLRRGIVVALTAAAIFVLHPIATETVSWLASRFDLLAVAFSLTSLCCFTQSLRRPAGGAWWRIAAVLAFALAILAKESAAVLPIMAVLVAFEEDRQPTKLSTILTRLAGAIQSTIPLWLTLGIFLAARTAQLGTVGAYTDYLTSGRGEIPANLLYHSRMILFVPFDVDAYVARNEYIRSDLAPWATIVPLVLVVALAVVAARVRFGLVLIVIALLPVLTFNGGGRIVYLAIVGYALVVGEVVGLAVEAICGRAGGLNRVRGRDVAVPGAASVLLAGLIGALLIGYALTARDRNRIWSQAGELVRSVPARAVTLYPGLPPGAVVYVRGLPDQWREVYVFRNVLPYRFELNGNDHAPDLSDQEWDQPLLGEIVPVTSFPVTVRPVEACRTFFAQYEHDILTWQPVPFPPTPDCRPAGDASSLPGSTSTSYSFGNGAQLRAFRLSPGVVEPGQPVQVDLVWQSTGPFTQNYRTFVHIAGEGGLPVAQRDSEPFDGRYPTSVWTPGIILTDSNRITIPTSLTPRNYDVIVGL